jgi:uncharacterized membrane protein YqjE
MNGPVVTSRVPGGDHTGNQHRSLGVIVAEIRDELKSFVHTRVEMMRSELDESLAAARVGLPLMVLALLLGAVGFLLLSVAVAVLVAGAFAGNPYGWFLGFLIVGLLWTLFAAVAAFFAYNAFRKRFPKRTLEVLKADKMWLQSEVRSQP